MATSPSSIGPYVVERQLGRGGMGVVYVCRHPQLPRSVAVKQVLSRGADARALQRFEREAALMAKVRHPAIVAVHELGRTPDGPYIVMELVEGQPLDRVGHEAPLDPATAARIVRDLALALAAMHGAGVIHRDIKPSNVLLRPDGAPVLLDFGLARELAAERLTRTGEVLGTVAYMPPEQADGRNTELDGRADVYALGAVLYELLAGRPPYTGGGIQVLAKILRGETPPPPSSVDAQVPPELEAIVRVAMASRREDRYPTAQALAADLGRFLAGAPVQALGRSRRPRRGLALGLAAVALAAVGVGLVLARTPATAAAPTQVDEAATAEREPADAAPRALWEVEADEALVYALEFQEDSGGQAIQFACYLVLRPAEQTPERLSFDCEVVRLSCRWIAGGADLGGQEYRSDASDPAHLLSFLGAAVGQPLSCVLEPRSGAVSTMSGFEAIRLRVAAQPRASLEALQGLVDSDRMVEVLVGRVFSDEFIGAAMDSLTCVQGDGRRVPWRAGAGGGYRVLPTSEPRPPVLAALTTNHGADDEFLFDGESTYARGRVQRARLKQELVRAPGRTHVMTWSMTLQP